MAKKSKFIFAILLSSSLFISPSVRAEEQNTLLDVQPNNTPNLQKSLQVLSNAGAIEGSHIGYAAQPNPGYQPINRAFKEAVAQGDSINIIELKELMKQASPAGHLYLAALIQRLDKSEGDRLLTILQSDESIVTERSGCTVENRKVGEVAAELLKNGSLAIALP
ncbi:hypothetical protein [Merismopedia glauca]|uniref:DUF1400 domain-containing protein n=1 Tax=Merismopedia glauca CCAP 1448/3 TaxID=1296344 RepID=A0A2T1C4W7_9CYAN|nr:hypothetical protein [Merismopedia glauca]PSB03320.1 hypothetical protein C7B64_09090 [Merismopedia glauca CCAP 1448/3]